jgi:hypothetical protein
MAVKVGILIVVAAVAAGCVTTTRTLPDGTVETIRQMDAQAVAAVAAIGERDVPAALQAWATYEQGRAAIRAASTTARAGQKLQELQSIVAVLRGLAGGK